MWQNRIAMKLNYLLTGLFICCFGIVSAQTDLREYTFQPSIKGSTSHALSTPKFWLMPFNVDDCNSDVVVSINKRTGLYKYLSTPENQYLTIHIFDIAQIDSNGFICVGLGGENTDEINLMNALIYKMDSDGNILWSVPFNWNDIDGRIDILYAFQKIVVSNDGNIYAIAPGHYIAKTDLNGNKRWMKAFPKCLDMGLKGDSLVVIYSDSLSVLDANGNAKHINISTPYNDFSNALNASSLTAGSSIYVTVLDSIKSYKLNHGKNWSKALPGNCSISGLAYDSINHQIAVTGIQTDGITKCPFFKSYDIDGSTNPITTDIGITKIDAAIISNTTSSQPGFASYNITANVNVVVKNFGPETIDSLTVESIANDKFFTVPLGNCLENNSITYHGLNLKTGDTVTLYLGQLTRFYVPAGKNNYTFNFTVNTASPNGKLDGNSVNDTFTFSKSFSGIDMANKKDLDIKVYPNPFQNQLTVENNSNLVTDYLIYDMTGKLLASAINQNTYSTFGLSTLPLGIYVLKIRNPAGIIQKKIVKD